MIPIFPSVIKLFEDKNLNIKDFDAVFFDLTSAVNNGYFTISYNNGIVYLFIVGGKPYASGMANKDSLSLLDVQYFFDSYSSLETTPVVFYKVEKKLLLSILVYFKKQPSHKFRPDMVDMKKVLMDLAQKGNDCMIALGCGEKTGFCICMKGRPSFNYFHDSTHSQEQPMDALLIYIYSKPNCVTSIEIFDDIQMSPSSDGISPKDELPNSLTAHYFKKQAFYAPTQKLDASNINADNIVNKNTIIKPDNILVTDATSKDFSNLSIHNTLTKGKDGIFVKDIKIKSNNPQDIEDVKKLDSTPAPSETQIKGKEIKDNIEQSPIQVKKISESKLVIDNGREHILQSTVTTIGFGDEMELKLEGRVIAEHQVSIMRGKNNEYTLMHKGGRSTTKVNTEKVPERRLLKNGDIIGIGQYKIKYVVS